VDHKEYAEQIAIRKNCGVELHLDNLSVARHARADVAVAWPFHAATRVARLHRFNPLELIENRLQAPEASAGKRCGFKIA
jgi:hypothetical protein